MNFRRLAFLPKQKKYRSLEFVFSKNWLERNCQVSSERILLLVQLLAGKANHSFMNELVDEISFETAKSIASDVENENISTLHIKSRIFTFLDLFFQKTIQRADLVTKKKKSPDYAVLSQVEKSLSRLPGDEMPSIAGLAKEFNIGSSTLKRQFKLIYNKSIYNYYLEQKMAMGMNMLEEPNASVSDIAYKLGYQKINSFSKIFKKHFGILPSEVIPHTK